MCQQRFDSKLVGIYKQPQPHASRTTRTMEARATPFAVLSKADPNANPVPSVNMDPGMNKTVKSKERGELEIRKELIGKSKERYVAPFLSTTTARNATTNRPA
jgi:hypothetical protein